ncbi:MAG: hypothetical protein J6P46_00630 [Bacteroidales bacterium]|nr:hypothetical protein [Bacteroidales bacterium]
MKKSPILLAALLTLAACTGKAPEQDALIEGLATGLDLAEVIEIISSSVVGESLGDPITLKP